MATGMNQDRLILNKAAPKSSTLALKEIPRISIQQMVGWDLGGREGGLVDLAPQDQGDAYSPSLTCQNTGNV